MAPIKALACSGRVSSVAWAMAHTWHEDGISIAKIASRLDVSRSTIYRQLAAAEPPGQRLRRRRRQRREVLARRRRVVALAKKVRRIVGWRGRSGRATPIVLIRHCFGSVRRIARELRRRGLVVSASTVRRDLLASGLRSRVRPKGPRRKLGDERTRKRFSIEYLKRMKAKDFERHVFSDEKMCDTNDHTHRFVWCNKNQRPPHCEREKFAAKIHVWAAVGVGYRKLVWLPGGGIDGGIYVRKCLSPCVNELKHKIFMQDGARAHIAGEAYLRKRNVEVLPDWPPRSPDLNPIETIWGRLQAKVSENGPTNEQELAEMWEREFYALDQAEIDALVRSFPHRLRECVRRNGKTIESKSMKKTR